MPSYPVKVWDGSQWVEVAAQPTDLTDYVKKSANTGTIDLTGTSFVPPVQTSGRNRIINGDFSVWQRGTSFNVTSSNTFFADRWVAEYDGSGATRTISQQAFAPGQTTIFGVEPRFFLRWNQSVAGTGGSYNILEQRIEDVRTFAGQAVTVSFWAKADTSRNIIVNYSQVYDPIGGSNSYNNALGSSNTLSLTSSWQRFSVTGTIASVSGKTISSTGSYLRLDFLMPINSTFTIDIWGVQMEAGSVATPFEVKSYGEQLRDCQRYYCLSYPVGQYPGQNTGGQPNKTAASGNNNLYGMTSRIFFPTTMRIAPNVTIYAQDGTINQWTWDIIGVGSEQRASNTEQVTANSFIIVSSSLTNNRNNAWGHWVANAEL